MVFYYIKYTPSYGVFTTFNTPSYGVYVTLKAEFYRMSTFYNQISIESWL